MHSHEDYKKIGYKKKNIIDLDDCSSEKSVQNKEEKEEQAEIEMKSKKMPVMSIKEID